MVSVEAPIRKFTVAEYQQMAEAGILHEDDRVELIEVHREPAGEGFQYMKALGREDSVSPLFSNAVVVTLLDVLP